MTRSVASGTTSKNLATPPTNGPRPGSVMVSIFDEVDGPGLRLSDFPTSPIDDKANLEAIGMPLPVQPKKDRSMV